MSHYAPNSTGLLAPLNPWLEDDQVSEILLNQPQEIWVEKQGALKRHDVPAMNHRMLQMLFQLLANENRQVVSEKQPLLSASLEDGSRVQIVLPPTSKHHTLSIRRKVARHLNLDNYKDSNFYHQAFAFNMNAKGMENLPKTEQELVLLYREQNWDAFIRRAIELKKNIVISGGTSSGKTTFLNACLRHISNDERIILLEDVREVEIPHPNQVSLLASKGKQGVADVSMQDLVQCCLRLRPDRIIVGEIRGAEILDFLGAASTGHEGSITSVHANNPSIAMMRMTQMYKLNNVPSMSDADIYRELNEVIDIIIQVKKTDAGRAVHSIHYKHGAIE